MKKNSSLILAILLLLVSTTNFSGCKAESDGSITLTVLMELDAKGASTQLSSSIKKLYPEKNIALKFEYLSADPIKREGQLSYLRTEIMAGKGPDIFILPTWDVNTYYDDGGNKIPRNEPLFKDMDDAMRNGVFYPLDDLIANSEHLNMEDHIQVVMDAGKTERGQMVLPLLFSYKLNLLDKSKMENTDTSVEKFTDLMETGDRKLITSVKDISYRWIHRLLFDPVDFESETLNMSQQELADMFKAVGELSRINSSDIRYVPERGFMTNGAELTEELLLAYNVYFDETYPYVMPNMEGGITADISAYCAINANTEHPEEAFLVLDFLYSDEIQSEGRMQLSDEVYVACFIKPMIVGASNGIKTNQAAYTEKYYSEAWQTIQDIHSRITYAKFTSEFDCMLCDAWNEVDLRLYSESIDSIDLDAIAAELYSDWKMMVAE